MFSFHGHPSELDFAEEMPLEAMKMILNHKMRAQLNLVLRDM